MKALEEKRGQHPLKPTDVSECVDELAPIASVFFWCFSAPFEGKSDRSKPAKSPSPVQALTFLMMHCIVFSAASLASEVMEWNVDEPSEPPLLMAEKETVRKSIGQRLREKLASMIRIRRGFTVDSGAADHVMPLGWLAWLAVTASFGSLSGMNFISANGARIPNKGEQRVRFMTGEGTWATWVFQVAGINKPSFP